MDGWIRLGFANPVERGGMLDVCLCGGYGDVGGEWVWGLEGWVGVMPV